MAYFIDDDLLMFMSESELAVLTGDPTGTTVDYDRIEACRESGEMEINSILSKEFSLPILEDDPVPPDLRFCSIKCCLYNLWAAYRKDTDVPEIVLWEKRNAIQIINNIVKGNQLQSEVFDSYRLPKPQPLLFEIEGFIPNSELKNFF